MPSFFYEKDSVLWCGMLSQKVFQNGLETSSMPQGKSLRCWYSISIEEILIAIQFLRPQRPPVTSMFVSLVGLSKVQPVTSGDCCEVLLIDIHRNFQRWSCRMKFLLLQESKQSEAEGGCQQEWIYVARSSAFIRWPLGPLVHSNKGFDKWGHVPKGCLGGMCHFSCKRLLQYADTYHLLTFLR